MKKECYVSLMNYFRLNTKLCRILVVIEKGLEISTVIAYLVLLSILLFQNINFAFRSAITSLLALTFCTILRKKIHSPRPYELFGTPSVMGKTKKGESFPSRHLTSISVISISFLYIFVPLGITFLAASLIMATLRVLLGAHFIKDVSVGAIIGWLFGIIGIYLI